MLITVTPISRPVVKMPSKFFWQRELPSLSLVSSSDRVRTAPVSSVDGCVRITDRARHPSGSSSGPTEACALAAWPPQKNVGAAPHPKEFHRTVAAGVPAPIVSPRSYSALNFMHRFGDSAHNIFRSALAGLMPHGAQSQLSAHRTPQLLQC